MKKTKKVLSSLLFFLSLIFLMLFCFELNFYQNKTYAKNQNIFKFEIVCDDKRFCFFENDFKDLKLSNFQKQMRESKSFKENFVKLKKLGLNQKEIVEYIFPETKIILNKIKSIVEILPTKEDVFVVQNECKLEFSGGESGRFLNEIEFYEKVYNELSKQTKKITVKIKTQEYNLQKTNKNEFIEKSCFSTNFESSSFERKNNIRVALSCFDGFVLEDGEVLSFNTVTGERNKNAGYMPAKIISGGTFTLGFGGGVCQVSTTLYNACLLSGLEILEVHNHSLPVSYIEPSFDAMVNTGSSDLVIRNNSGGRLIFTTSSKNDICKVKIFGKPNEFKITRFSEKIKIIPAEKEEVITDPKKAEEFGVFEGTEKRISFAKDGFESNGYLRFYDKNGTLVETKKIRTNKYNPTKGVIVKNAG